MHLYNKYLEEFKQGIIGYATIGILVQSCISSMAVMFILQNGHSYLHMLQIFIMAILSLSFNGAVLSQQKPKIIFNIFLITVTVALLLLIINIAI